MYKIIILFRNNSSETVSPISTKFLVDPTVETEFRVCSNDHTPFTIYGKKNNKKKHILLFENQELLK